MGRWTGEALTVQVGAKWTYKIRLEEETAAGKQSKLILGTRIFDREEEAREAGTAHVKEEVARRSA